MNCFKGDVIRQAANAVTVHMEQAIELPRPRVHRRRSVRVARAMTADMNTSALQSANERWASEMHAVAVSRDRDAFARLFDHFAPRVKAFVMRSGICAEMAEEIAQETLIMAWRKAEQFDESKATVSTWLFAICRNKRIDRLRRENRPEPDPNDPIFAPDPLPAQDDALSASQDVERLKVAMAELPADQREALSLSFISGHPHPEIARQLGIPIGTVKSRIRLALLKLRGILEDEEA